MKVSVVVITYNEEARVRDCVASVHDWCDEIVVLDSHSTDRAAGPVGHQPRWHAGQKKVARWAWIIRWIVA